LIVGRLYDEPLVVSFKRLLNLFTSLESQAIYLKGFVHLLSSTHKAECLELKDVIISAAQEIYGKTRFGFAHFHSSDVIESFNKV